MWALYPGFPNDNILQNYRTISWLRYWHTIHWSYSDFPFTCILLFMWACMILYSFIICINTLWPVRWYLLVSRDPEHHYCQARAFTFCSWEQAKSFYLCPFLFPWAWVSAELPFRALSLLQLTVLGAQPMLGAPVTDSQYLQNPLLVRFSSAPSCRPPLSWPRFAECRPM